MRSFVESFNTPDEEGVSPRSKLRWALTIVGIAMIIITIHLYAFDSNAMPEVKETAVPTIVKSEKQPKKQKTEEKVVAKKKNKKTEGKCRLSKEFPESIRQWCPVITKYAQQNGLNPDLVGAIIWQESGGNPVAYSGSGAVGLMQVMPRDGVASSFTCVNGPCFKNRPSIKELQDPEFNIKYGTAMLSSLVKKHGSVREALVAYGPMNVGYYYSDKVLGLYKTSGGE